ncbi:MAG: ATP-dependent helicase [Gemmatales bacterium]
MILTDEQRSSVNCEENSFLQACPGSGKTRAIVAKVLACLREIRGTTRQLACITYTNAAVDEISERVKTYCLSDDDDHLEINTIHSFCLNAILRHFYWKIPELKNGFEIATPDSDTYQTIVAQTVHDHDLGHQAIERFAQISRDVDGSPIFEWGLTDDAVTDFWKRLEVAGHVDFPSILYHSYKLLQDYPTLSYSLACKYRWILIDEFQDTTSVQIELFKLIAAHGQSKFYLVGDPQQSIFGFAGAKPELMAEFAKVVHAKTDFALTKNFRCSTNIIVNAENLIPRTPAMVAAGQHANDVHQPAFLNLEFKTAILNQFIPALFENGISFGKAAILASTWPPLYYLARSLRKEGIPVVGPGARPYKSTRTYARLLEHACAYVANPVPERIRGLEKEVFRVILNITGSANYEVYSFNGKKALVTIMRKLDALSKNYEGAMKWIETSATVINKVLVDFGLLLPSCSTALVQSSTEMISDIQKNRVDLTSASLEDLGVYACPDKNIKLMTIHGSKGREFDAVAIIDLHETRIPHSSCKNDPAKLDASKRLLYVAITRAKRLLFYVADPNNQNAPSRFLKSVRPTTLSVITKRS